MLCDTLTFRASNNKDLKAVRSVEKKAFGRSQEAKLVETLINAPDKTYSYVAKCNDEIVGHVLLTKIDAPVKALALAPLAVLPKYREMQIGSKLVRFAIEAAKANKYNAIFVLGDVLYYERFGFSSKLANPFKIKWQGDNFMALELSEGSLKGKAGELSYPQAFFEL